MKDLLQLNKIIGGRSVILTTLEDVKEIRENRSYLLSLQSFELILIRFYCAITCFFKPVLFSNNKGTCLCAKT